METNEKKYINALKDIQNLYIKLLKENRIYHNNKHGETIFEIANKAIKNK
jgi:hypothetical protein